MQEDNAVVSSLHASHEDGIPKISTHWTELAIEEATDILTKPSSVTGWDGIGYSVMVGGEERSHDFFAMRGCDYKRVAGFLQCIRRHNGPGSTPIIRYYASYDGASVLTNEVWRLREGNVIVVAQVGYRGIERAGKVFPPPSAEQLQSSPLTMIMVRDICHEMAKVGNRFWLRSLMGDIFSDGSELDTDDLARLFKR